MSKKHFIQLADAIRIHNKLVATLGRDAASFTQGQIAALADFCKSQNPNFNRDRWLGYIAGTCGPNGGSR